VNIRFKTPTLIKNTGQLSGLVVPNQQLIIDRIGEPLDLEQAYNDLKAETDDFENATEETLIADDLFYQLLIKLGVQAAPDDVIVVEAEPSKEDMENSLLAAEIAMGEMDTKSQEYKDMEAYASASRIAISLM
jgi:hypothetical protein